MEILIAATKTCPHRPLLEDILKDAWLPYKVIYLEDDLVLLEKYQIKQSPLLIVDEKIESVGMPGIDKINELVNKNKVIAEFRTPKRAKNHMIPANIDSEAGLVEEDTTWGSIQPMQAGATNLIHIRCASLSKTAANTTLTKP